MKDADLILYVVDASTNLDENDGEIMELLHGRRTIVLLNKSDLTPLTTAEDIRVHVDKDCPVISISAREQKGIDVFTEQIRKMFFRGEVTFNDEEQSIADGMPEDFYSIDLMNAYEVLGTIIGEAVEDDLVNEIFSKFCLGK